MKKIFVILATLVILFPTIGLSENDYSNYSLEELYEIRDCVQTEIDKRLLNNDNKARLLFNSHGLSYYTTGEYGVTKGGVLLVGYSIVNEGHFAGDITIHVFINGFDCGYYISEILPIDNEPSTLTLPAFFAGVKRIDQVETVKYCDITINDYSNHCTYEVEGEVVFTID